MVNKWTYLPPFTSEQIAEDYCNKGMSQDEIALKYGTTQKVVWRAMQKWGIETRPQIKRDQKGAANSFWKGGRVQTGTTKSRLRIARYLNHTFDKAYWMLLLPNHPNAQRSGYIMEHIVVALEAAERERLNPDECVHHINFDRKDNRPENLLICTKDKHREYHGRLELLTRELLLRGIVRFDAERGYVIAEDS